MQAGELTIAQGKCDPGKVRKSLKLPIPVDKYPQFNFVGRLLGPRGSTLKQLQRDTSTWIRIRGRGSMRDKLEEAQKRTVPGNEHLNEPLHVTIEAHQPPEFIDQIIYAAKEKVEHLLIPVEESKDMHKREQLRQLAQVRLQEQMGSAYTGAEAGAYGQAQGYYNPYQQYGQYNPYSQQQQQQQYSAQAYYGGAAAPEGGAQTYGTQAAYAQQGVAGVPSVDPHAKLDELKKEQKALSAMAKMLPNCVKLLDAEISKVVAVCASTPRNGAGAPAPPNAPYPHQAQAPAPPTAQVGRGAGTQGNNRYHPYAV